MKNDSEHDVTSWLLAANSCFEILIDILKLNTFQADAYSEQYCCSTNIHIRSCSLFSCSYLTQKDGADYRYQNQITIVTSAIIIVISMFVGCLTSQQQASVSRGRICSDNFTCCHTEIEVADPTLHLTQLQYTDTSPSTGPTTLSAWQGSRWSEKFSVTGMTQLRTNPFATGIRTLDLPLSRRTP